LPDAEPGEKSAAYREKSRAGFGREWRHMLILTLVVRLRAPWCHSLKDKRSEVKKLLARLRAKFNLSAAEVGAQDVLTQIELGIAAICFDHTQADSISENVTGFIEANTEAELLSVEKEVF